MVKPYRADFVQRSVQGPNCLWTPIIGQSGLLLKSAFACQGDILIYFKNALFLGTYIETGFCGRKHLKTLRFST